MLYLKVSEFSDYCSGISNIDNRNKFIDLLNFVKDEFHDLEAVVKWSQPMFILHGTFIIGFSVTKNHVNVAPEKVVVEKFKDYFDTRDVSTTKMLIQMKWNKDFDYELVKKLIEYNIVDKEKTSSFWR